MNKLIQLIETYSNGYNTSIIDIISAIAITCGIYVIVSKNPIISVLFLIGLFLSIASYLIIIGINFIGISYLLVYVGAVSILFIFILMLINIRISELLNDARNSIPLVFLIGIPINILALQLIPYNNKVYKEVDYLFTTGHNELLLISNNNWEKNIWEFTNIESIGNILYTNYSIWIILTSIILLLAMVGSIIITIKQSND